MRDNMKRPSSSSSCKGVVLRFGAVGHHFSVITRRTCLLALVALLIVASVLTPARSARAASNGTWSVYPTTAPGAKGRVVFSPTLTPGVTVPDSVTIANLSPSPRSFNLYAADAFNTPGGGLSLRRRVDPVEGMGAWIRLAHSAAVVPAHGSVAVPFVIVVPSQATPGDHVGGIVAEATSGTTSSRGSVPITVIQAVGVRVYGRVQGATMRRLAVEKPAVHVESSVAAAFGGSSRVTITVRVANRGNVVLTPVAHLQLRSTFGSVETQTFELGPILPGESVTTHHSATVHVTGQLRATVSVAAGSTRASARSSAWSLPWGLLMVLLVLLALVALFAMRKWGRRQGRPEPVGEAPG